MDTIAELQSRFAQPGRVEQILVRPGRDVAMQRLEDAELGVSGLDGDRARAGKRAVTLLQAEHLPVIASLIGQEAIDPAILRRNILISGLNIAAFRGKRLAIGDAVIDLTLPCHPCSKMERVLGPGGYTAMRGHGGVCASVVTPGRIVIGDPVVVAEA